MRTGYKVTLGILTVMILMTLTVGTSYSYFAVADAQNGQNNLSSSCFNVNFLENSSSINLGSAYPMNEQTAVGDGQNGVVKPYSFTITNNCSKDVNYVVTYSTLTNKDELAAYTNYKISEGSVGKVDNDYKKITQAQPYNNLPSAFKSGVSATYEFEYGILKPGESNKKTFYLYLWIDDNSCQQNSCKQLMGKTLEGKVMVYTYM